MKNHSTKNRNFVVFILLIATVMFSLFGCSNEDAFEKSIDANDIKLEYVIYSESFITVTITALTDIQDLNLQVLYYQKSNILRQDSESLNIDSLKQDESYYCQNYDLSDTYPFDRVEITNISGKKKNSSEPLLNKIRLGTIKAPIENLNSSLFTVRFDITTANNGSYGTAYIKSSINLYEVSFGIYESFTNQFGTTYYPSSVSFIANQEVAVELKKLSSDTGNLSNISLTNIKGRTIEDIVIT